MNECFRERGGGGGLRGINLLVRSMRSHPRIRESCVTSITVAKHLTPTPTHINRHMHTHMHSLIRSSSPAIKRPSRQEHTSDAPFFLPPHTVQCTNTQRDPLLPRNYQFCIIQNPVWSRAMQHGNVPKYSTLINSVSTVGERGEALFNKEEKHASTKHNLILSERDRM